MNFDDEQKRYVDKMYGAISLPQIQLCHMGFKNWFKATGLMSVFFWHKYLQKNQNLFGDL